MVCRICETGFFTKRYKSLEMAQIYQDYRGVEYVRKRLKWEPWYTSAYNNSHDSDDYFFSRKNSLEKFLLSNDISSSKVTADVGGDRGQFIPDFTEDKIVVDISAKELIPGIRRVSSIDQLTTVDLIIYAHTLEHVADPISELRRLFEKCSKIYVEVPYGVPEISKSRRSFVKFWIKFMSSLRPEMWAKSTQPATGRVMTSTKILTQSEHLTFFTEKSFQTIAKILGVSLVMERNTITTPDLSQGTVLQCLLTRRSVNI